MPNNYWPETSEPDIVESETEAGALQAFAAVLKSVQALFLAVRQVVPASLTDLEKADQAAFTAVLTDLASVKAYAA